MNLTPLLPVTPVPDPTTSSPTAAAPYPRVLLRDGSAGRWLRLAEPQTVLVARTADEVIPALEAAERMAREHGLHVAGFLGYEAAPAVDSALVTKAPGWLPLAWFAAFAEAHPAPPPLPPDDVPTFDWLPSLDATGYRVALGEIRRLIAAGDTYQVNFSYRLRAVLGPDWLDRLDDLFAAMTTRQPEGLGAFIETADWAILCASHELFFDWAPPVLLSRPMKGTVERGADTREDRQHAAWLAASPKNRAENLMITDMVRNDLGRIAIRGSVRATALFELERYPTLWQMTSTVRAETAGNLAGIVRALFPAASITGAPKCRTMAIIRDLEDGPRQIYTGTIGYLRPDGSARFNVAIRTALVDKRTGLAEYGVGGGIVWDSDPGEEYAESRAKALILDRSAPAFELLETLRWTPGEGYGHLELHLERLADAADYFGYPLDRRAIDAVLAAAVDRFPPEPRRVRLLVDAAGRIRVTDADLAPLPADYRLALAPVALPVEHDPFVRHKTTHRAVYAAARRLAPDADDVLLWNRRGEVTESTIGNVVAEIDGDWVTPPVASGILPGVGRRRLLESGKVRERVLRREDLVRCTRLALVNSLRGSWSVRLVDADPAAR